MQLSVDSWCSLPTPVGDFRMYDTGEEGVRVISLGDLRELGSKPLVRVHSSCVASEVFGSLDCDCADQLRESMKMIASEGRGLIVHLHQEGRGHGLSVKIRAVQAMERKNLDTVQAFDFLGLEQDARHYDAAVEVLSGLGITHVRLISNNPRKKKYLIEKGIKVDSLNTHPKIRPENAEYLRTKSWKLGHNLPVDTGNGSSGTIQFYHSDQPWGELSNFSQHSVFINDRIWPTVEHFYQAQKFVGTRYEEEIRLSATPTSAKQRAYAYPGSAVRPDWASVKENIMLEGLRAKFTQHPDLREKLLRSGNRWLAEHTEHDSYWGDAGDGSGKNRLGNLLMQVRLELSQNAESKIVAG